MTLPDPRGPTWPMTQPAEPDSIALPRVAPRRRGVLAGLVVIAMGVPFILQPLGVPNAPSYLFLAMGLAFLISYLRGRQYVYLIPMVMFGSLAALFVVTWHKGAVIRAMLRAVLEPRPRAEVAPSLPAEATPRQRIEVGRAPQVRVHTSELQPGELIGQTDVDRKDSARVARAQSS